MSILNDAILKEMYMEYDTPCDRLVSDPGKLLLCGRLCRPDRSGG